MGQVLFFQNYHCISLIIMSLLYTLEKGVAFNLKKFEFPSSLDDLCHAFWLKFAPWSWRKYLKCRGVFSLFDHNHQLEHLNKF